MTLAKVFTTDGGVHEFRSPTLYTYIEGGVFYVEDEDEFVLGAFALHAFVAYVTGG